MIGASPHANREWNDIENAMQKSRSQDTPATTIDMPTGSAIDLSTLQPGRSCGGDLLLYTEDGTPVARMLDEVGGHPMPAEAIAERICEAMQDPPSEENPPSIDGIEIVKNHTPGPWHRPGRPWVFEERFEVYSEADPNAGKFVAGNEHAKFSPETYEEGEAEANARLIANAPLLQQKVIDQHRRIEALKAALYEQKGSVIDELVEALRDADQVLVWLLEDDALGQARVSTPSRAVQVRHCIREALAKARPEAREETA